MPRRAELAILFADVADSTRLYESLGDERAREIVRRCVAGMAEVTRRHGGCLVTTIGDEVYCTFPTADAAMAAASTMQEGITGKAGADGRRIAIHVGLHFGPVLLEEGCDPSGDAVNVANRMVKGAKAGQILTTGPTVALASTAWQAACRPIGCAQLKGKRESTEVFELVWRAEEATVMRRVVPSPRTDVNAARLTLTLGDVTVELSQVAPTLTIGRDAQNDLVVPDSIVSRLHARAEYRNGRFVLTDQSVNGTYVLPDSGPGLVVHNDHHVLSGTGTLGLGEMPEAGGATTLRYRVVTWRNAEPMLEGMAVPPYSNAAGVEALGSR